MRSISRSLMVGSALMTVIVLSLGSVAIYRGAKRVLFHQFDEALADDARVLASTVRTWGDEINLEFDDVDIREFQSPDGRGYLQLTIDGDRVLYRSPNLRGSEMAAATGGELNRPVLRWMQVEDVGRVRAVDLRFVPAVNDEHYEAGQVQPPRTKPTPTVHLVAALEPTEVNAFLARLRTLLVAIGALSGLLAMISIATVIRTTLRPLNDLADEIAHLDDARLSARIRMKSVPTEIKPVVDQLNQLLVRIEAAFQRERTFSADIAHELRNPLAGLRSTIEVMLSQPRRREEEYRETLGELLEIIRRVQAVAETLLYLGRLEAGQVEIERSAVDLGEITTTSWKPLVERAEARRLAVHWALSRDVAVVTDPVLLEVAIRNLLENAVVYADEGGYIRIEVVNEGESGVLRVANSGSMVAQDRVEDLLERFTRADPSRATADGHSGLGLALVSKITAVLRYSMRIDSRDGGEFCVTLSSNGS